jgi:hypothetical protein
MMRFYIDGREVTEDMFKDAYENPEENWSILTTAKFDNSTESLIKQINNKIKEYLWKSQVG